MNFNGLSAGTTGMTGRSYTEHRRGVYEEEARRIHQAENDARPGRPRIQVAEITYVRNVSEALPDLDTFLKLV